LQQSGFFRAKVIDAKYIGSAAPALRSQGIHAARYDLRLSPHHSTCHRNSNPVDKRRGSDSYSQLISVRGFEVLSDPKAKRRISASIPAASNRGVYNSRALKLKGCSPVSCLAQA